MLENRLRKRHRHLRKWARRRQVSCYRLYDRDIPEIPLAIDLYTEDGGAQHLYLARFRREQRRQKESGASEEHTVAAQTRWTEAMAVAAARALGGPGTGDSGEPEAIAVHIKQRQRQRGTWQYQRTGETGNVFTVLEGGHRFLVNLDDHLDTGLFLDHRPLRARIGREATGAQFLNLFCYTGAITVYAARSGALASESVDLSQRYLAWAADNLEANSIDLERHRLVRADVFDYLAAPGQRRFDLAVLDPPTFSNSKRMRGVLDIQRDHPRLIARTLARLRPGGVLYFSCNARRFELRTDDLTSAASIEDISAETIPEDFRNRRAHRCWRIVAGDALEL